MAIWDRIGRRRTDPLVGVGLAGVVVAGVLLCALSVPTSAQSRTRTSRHKPHCAIPKGWHLVAKDSLAMIVTGTVRVAGPDGTESDPQWRYCLWHTGRMKVLFTDSGLPPGYVDITEALGMRLAGRYAAYYTYGELGGGRYGAVYGDTYVVDLQTGRSTQGGASCCSIPGGLLLSPSGVALWQVWSATPEQTVWLVEALSARTGTLTTLDQVPTTPPPQNGLGSPGPTPFANLQLQQCLAGCTAAGATFAWWTNSGVWHTARVA